MNLRIVPIDFVKRIAHIIGEFSGCGQALKKAETMKSPVFIQGESVIFVTEESELAKRRASYE